MSVTSNKLGERIRAWREVSELSMSELARRVGISKSYLHSIEAGKIVNPSFDVVMRIANELNIRAETLWPRQEPAKDIAYFVSIDGGYARGYGPMVDALLKIPGWRECTKEEHDAAEKSDMGPYAGED